MRERKIKEVCETGRKARYNEREREREREREILLREVGADGCA